MRARRCRALTPITDDVLLLVQQQYEVTAGNASR